MAERLECVRRLSFVAGLDGAELELLLGAHETRRFEPGQVIVEEGTRGEGLFLIDSGQAVVQKAVAGTRHEGIAELGDGDHFGEMSLLTDAPTSATVRARGAVVCKFLPRQRFLDLLAAHPVLGRKVLWSFAQTLAHRLVESDRRYARLLDRENRLAKVRHLVALMRVQTLIFWSYVWVWLRRRLRVPHAPEALARIHRRNARRFRETACRLKGANVKLGQLASLQTHILPREVIEELRSMRDQVPPTEFPLIAGLVQSELGAGPLEVFAEFDRVPLAAASMGQVHAARLHTGERVVVKVLHPGLERSVEVDLWLIRTMFRVLGRFVKKLDLMQLYRESEEPLRKELDLLAEAHATEEMGRQLAPMGVRVPRVHWRYSTRRLLTLEFIEGTKLDDLAKISEWKVDRTRLMQQYLRAFLEQALEGGFFHCDPHPANAFVTPSGELVLLDFGMVKRLPDVIRAGLYKEVLGSFFNNPTLYADGIIMRGVIEERDRGHLERFAREVFSDPDMRSAIFDHDVKRDGDMKQLSGKMGALLEQLETFKTPQDQLMFLRALGIVIDVCREVVPEMPVSQLVAPIAMPLLQRFLAKHPQYAQAA